MDVSDASPDSQSSTHDSTGLDCAALFDRSPDPMLAVDPGDPTTVEIANRSFEETFVDEGRADVEFQLSATVRDAVRDARTGETQSVTVTRSARHGRRTFDVDVLPALQSNARVFVRYRDVTERRIRDQQLAVLRRVLRHDLRNDLTVLLGYARTIQATTDEPKTAEAAGTMVQSADDLQRVAASAGRLNSVTVTPDPTRLDDVLARTRRTVEEYVEGPVAFPGDVPRVPVDDRVGMAIEELCRTLVGDGDASGVALDSSVEDDRVILAVSADADPSEQQLAALEGRAETKLRHASGIGPWITRWAVSGAGGQLTIERERRGVEVRLEVPVLSDAAPDRAAPQHHPWPER